MRATEAGTQERIPHRSQVDFRANHDLTEFYVNGLHYKKGRGDPGSDAYGCLNNCLIDSLRQSVGISSDGVVQLRRQVRRDLETEFSSAEGDARVSRKSFLDIDSHWKAVLSSLFQHASSPPESMQLN